MIVLVKISKFTKSIIQIYKIMATHRSLDTRQKLQEEQLAGAES